ncbi:MAG: phosphoribosylanthranilate isomerase [Acidobacteria bacterium]|nr:phosphoribosylanthranilate isomerase [Acidobacteriota bacterium]
MTKVKVKICGVRTYAEAQTALEGGADALGFNFWPKSVRFITPDQARKIIQRLPPFLSCVGVFVNADAQRINHIVEQTGIQIVQLHGDEAPEFCQQLHAAKIIKAFRVNEAFDVEVIKTFSASAFLLDAKVKGEYGGTGQRFDWQIAIEAKKFAPIILAGGINQENVAEALRLVRPFAIDVCSGVEAEPGRKDLPKLREFMKTVEQANRSW